MDDWPNVRGNLIAQGIWVAGFAVALAVWGYVRNIEPFWIALAVLAGIAVALVLWREVVEPIARRFGSTPDSREPTQELVDGLTLRQRLSWFEIGLIKARNQLARLQNHTSALSHEREMDRHNLASLSTSFEVATTERDSLRAEAMRLRTQLSDKADDNVTNWMHRDEAERERDNLRWDRDRLQAQLIETQQKLILEQGAVAQHEASISALEAPSTPFDDKISQFVEAWLAIAFGQAMDLAMSVSAHLKMRGGGTGGITSALFDMAILAPASLANGNVHKKMRSDNDAPRETLDALAAKMYAAYQILVEWIWFGGRECGFPFKDNKKLQEWITFDRDFTNRLRELVTSPDLKASELRTCYEAIRDSGRAKQMRDNIAGYDQ